MKGDGRADYNGFFEGSWPLWLLFTRISFISASSPPPRSHHTVNTAYLLPARGGEGLRAAVPGSGNFPVVSVLVFEEVWILLSLHWCKP